MPEHDDIIPLGSVSASRELAAIVESSDDAIVSKNLDGIITSWNKSAERMFGYTAEEAIGQPITIIIPLDRRDEETNILARLREGKRIDHFETIRVRKDGTPLEISVTISPLKDATGRVVGASKVARDITERRVAENARKEAEMAARLLLLQDEERRRIAREMHDGVGQLLVAMSMNIAQVMMEKEKLSDRAVRCIEENSTFISQASTEIRTMSYLLHPPMLDEVGLQSALRWYVDGFVERSKVAVELELDPQIGRLPEDYELSIFRIVQECLTNVHRHSGSGTAFVRLVRSGKGIELGIRDNGRGISLEKRERISRGESTGVGFRGMRERVKLLGGTLTVQSGETGTSVVLTLPL